MTPIDDARRQEQRKRAGDLLKMADKLFKSQDFEGAARLVEMARQADPNNAYVIAYQERIKHALEQRDQLPADAGRPLARPGELPSAAFQQHPAATGRSVQEELKRKIEEAHRRLEEEQNRARQKDVVPVLEIEQPSPEPRVDLSKEFEDEAPPPPKPIELESPPPVSEVTIAESPEPAEPAPAVVRDIDAEVNTRLDAERERLASDIRRELEAELAERLREQIAGWEEERAKLQESTRAQLAAEQARVEEITREFQTVAAEVRRRSEEKARVAALDEAEKRLTEALSRRQSEADQTLHDLHVRHEAELEALRKETAEQAERVRQETAAEVRRQTDLAFSQRLTEELVRLEGDIRRRAEEEAARKLQAGQKALDDERTKWQDEVRRRAEEEAQKLSSARRQLEEAMHAQLTEEIRRTEEHRRNEQAKLDQLRKSLEEDAHRKIEAERQRLMSQVYEERMRISTEKEELESARRQFDAVRQRSQEQEFISHQEEKRQLEAQLRKDMAAELELRVQEERKAMEEKRQKDLYEQREARRQEFDQLRQEWEEEHRRILAEELQRERADMQRRIEAEAQKRRTEEAARYDDAIRQAIDEGRREAQKKKIQAHLDTAKASLARFEFEEALHEITKLQRLDPSNAAARDLEQTVYAAQSEYRKRKAAEHQQVDDQVRQYEQVQRRLTTQAREDADQQQVREQREYIVRTRMQAAERFYGAGDYPKALAEIEAALTLDPTNPQAKHLELAILSMKGGRKEADAASTRRAHEEEAYRQEEVRRSRVSEGIRENLKRESLLAYSNILRTAWRDGQPSQSEREVLDIARESLKVATADHASLEHEIQLESYREALQYSLSTGVLTLRDTQLIDTLRAKYAVLPEDHAAVEQQLRRTSPDRR